MRNYSKHGQTVGEIECYYNEVIKYSKPQLEEAIAERVKLLKKEKNRNWNQNLNPEQPVNQTSRIRYSRIYLVHHKKHETLAANRHIHIYIHQQDKY